LQTSLKQRVTQDVCSGTVVLSWKHLVNGVTQDESHNTCHARHVTQDVCNWKVNHWSNKLFMYDFSWCVHNSFMMTVRIYTRRYGNIVIIQSPTVSSMEYLSQKYHYTSLVRMQLLWASFVLLRRETGSPARNEGPLFLLVEILLLPHCVYCQRKPGVRKRKPK